MHTQISCTSLSFLTKARGKHSTYQKAVDPLKLQKAIIHMNLSQMRKTTVAGHDSLQVISDHGVQRFALRKSFTKSIHSVADCSISYMFRS